MSLVDVRDQQPETLEVAPDLGLAVCALAAALGYKVWAL